MPSLDKVSARQWKWVSDWLDPWYGGDYAGYCKRLGLRACAPRPNFPGRYRGTAVERERSWTRRKPKEQP